MAGHLSRTIEQLRDRRPAVHAAAARNLLSSGSTQRLPKHGEGVPRLQKNGILIDGEGVVDGGHTKVLLQIFSANAIGPIFFEFIQRKGDDGFGEGNFKALFEIHRGRPDPPRRAVGGREERGLSEDSWLVVAGTSDAGLMPSSIRRVDHFIFVVAGLVLSDFGYAEVADTTPLRDAVPSLSGITGTSPVMTW